MITCRTPLRVSFFGGGTDYPEYFERARGAVLGMAVDKYIYISALRLHSAIDYQFRLAYSRVETAHDPSQLQHPVVRSIVQHYGITGPLDLSVMADLPARNGLGSSSSFTVGLIHLLSALESRSISKLQLAESAVFVERELLAENVGVQDQHHAAFGGLNRFDFTAGQTRVEPIQMSAPCLAALTSSLFLVYTGKNRIASLTVGEQLQRTVDGKIDRELSHLLALVDHAVDVLQDNDPKRMLQQFGAMLHDGWETKRRLSSKVSNPEIDKLYETARQAGALGGKLCGAGNGGFLLTLVPPEGQARFLAAMPQSVVVPVSIDRAGSTILADLRYP